jgi:1-acyl-sn-glycerol-3-phosphate acyltransferase
MPLTWKTIPLDRGEANVVAFRRGLAALEEGTILAVAPEAKRSHQDRLLRERPSVVLPALCSGAPIFPLAYFDGKRFDDDFKWLGRTDSSRKLGEPFHLDADSVKVARDVRQQMIADMMCQI